MLINKQDPLFELSKKVAFINEEKESFAKDLAQYILEDGREKDFYEEFVKDGHDPRDHVYYKALVVIGAEDEVFDDVESWKARAKS